MLERLHFVCRNLQNRAGVRLLMACLLAKIHNPDVDIRKPYTKIGDPDAYSGRTYDEQYVAAFVTRHRLPANPTSAFLTPALRNRNITLEPEVNLVGNVPKLYQDVLHLLSDVYTDRVELGNLLVETIRELMLFRDERQQRMESLLAGLRTTDANIPLSAEAIVTLIQTHISQKRASRLPVLAVAAAYKAAEAYLGERVLPLHGHNAADFQTGALGDLDITLLTDEGIVTSYEMKARRVTIGDIDHALQKLEGNATRIDNYIFITTEPIDQEVKDYAAGIYDQTGGIEIVILDCIGFVRYFLHLFHRLRMQYLDAYQELVLAEPESAVNQPLKEAFLALRQAAESGE